MSINYMPVMTKNEINLLNNYFPKNGTCLEFGSGGTTQFFLEHGLKALYSVESDETWTLKLLENRLIDDSKNKGRWIPIHADIGAVQEWGTPIAQSPELIWLNYHQHCWEEIPENNFDMILIDGRFRVACVCQCLFRCIIHDTVFVIHDFWNRPHYHGVLKFLKEENRADTLGIFRPKKRLNWKSLFLLLQEHQFDYR